MAAMMTIMDIGTEKKKKKKAILNLYVAPMVPIKFRLNSIYRSGADVV